jgi:hypothetical protein
LKKQFPYIKCVTVHKCGLPARTWLIQSTVTWCVCWLQIKGHWFRDYTNTGNRDAHLISYVFCNKLYSVLLSQENSIINYYCHYLTAGNLCRTADRANKKLNLMYILLPLKA